MTTWEAFTTPLRQRYPFFSLLFAALAGILLAEFLPWPSLVWLLIALVASAFFFLHQPRWGIVAFVLGVFGVLHTWQNRESPAFQLAHRIGTSSPFVEAVGIVDNEPRVLSEKRASFRLRVLQLKTGANSYEPTLTVLTDWLGAPPAYGDLVKVRGALRNLPPPRNPGQFDFTAWSARHEIYSRLQVDKEPGSQSIISHHQGNSLVSVALQARAWMHRTLEAGVDDPAASDLIVAMVLGDTSSLPSDVGEEFRGTGTYHLFSVSGLHVGILAFLLWSLFRILRVGRRPAAASTIPLLFFYTLMTGLSAASVRSAIMASIVLAGYLANRKPVLFNNLCAAAFLILLSDTNQLFDAGFQLSFTVVASILLFAEPLAIGLRTPFQRDPFLPAQLLNYWQRAYIFCGRELAATISVSVAAWLGSVVLIIGYFHMISLTTLPANLVAVPVSFGIMSVSMLSLLAGTVSTWAAVVFNQSNWLLARLLLWLVHFFASLPGSYFYFKTPEYPQPLAEITVFDFGTGGAAFLQAGGKSWLIDCGPARYHDHVLLPFLRSQGLSTLDGLLLTHGDAGHIGATQALLSSCPPRQIVDSMLEDKSPTRLHLWEELVHRDVPKSLYRAGDFIRLGPDVVLRILYPSPKEVAFSADDQAMVVRLEAGSFRILLTSDATLDTKQILLKKCPDLLPCDLLIEGSPVTDSPKDSAFLDIANPQLVVLGGSDVFTPHPPPEQWMESRADKKFPLFAQDDTGAVTIRIYRDNFVVSGFVNKRQYTSSR